MNRDDSGIAVTVIAKYYEAAKVVEGLIRIGYDIASIHELTDSDWNGYKDEFIVTLSSLDGGTIWCEPFMYEGEYINDCSSKVFIMGDCNSEVIKHLACSEICEVEIGKTDDCGGNCEECDLRFEDDDDVIGFTINMGDGDTFSSVSFYSADRELVEKMAKEYM